MICIFSISFGSNTYNNVDVATLIGIDDFDFLIQEPYCITMKQHLNTGRNNQIPCDTTTVFSFSVSGLTLQITPNDYIIREDGKCKSRLRCHNYLNYLPVTVLRNRCILYDYKNNKIGLTDRIEPTEPTEPTYPTNPTQAPPVTEPTQPTQPTPVVPTKPVPTSDPLAYLPCRERIVFAIDDAATNQYFKVSRTFKSNFSQAAVFHNSLIVNGCLVSIKHGLFKIL